MTNYSKCGPTLCTGPILCPKILVDTIRLASYSPEGNNKDILSTCFVPGPVNWHWRSGQDQDRLDPCLHEPEVYLGIFLPSPGLPVGHFLLTEHTLPLYCWLFIYSTKEGLCWWLSGRESPANAGDVDCLSDPGGSRILGATKPCTTTIEAVL